jgi:hypothetical protein
MMNQLISWMVTLIFFATFGCSTPYQPLQRGTNEWGLLVGAGGGFSSRQIGENEFEIFFAGNGFTSMETVEEFWHRKANELCGSGNYAHTMATEWEAQFPRAKGTVTCGKNL